MAKKTEMEGEEVKQWLIPAPDPNKVGQYRVGFPYLADALNEAIAKGYQLIQILLPQAGEPLMLVKAGPKKAE
jgi:hypothetical protein